MNVIIQNVLLVEDNDDDVFLMRRSIKKAGVAWSINVATDGQQGLNYLAGVEEFSDRSKFPLPSLIFLDLKLPYVSGFDVLKWIQEQSSLKNIPTVILTSSPEARDQQKALELGAKAYLIKPPREEVLRLIAQDNWAGIRNSIFLQDKR